MKSRLLICIAMLALIQISPAPIRAWELKDESILPAHPSMESREVTLPSQADFDSDGSMESLNLVDGQARIMTGEILRWQSPSGWRVIQTALSDLNQDGQVEAALLVWRPFKPWPVDRWLPNGGRIDSFHNAQGESCHIILIGWRDGEYKERWAGSALAEPVKSFTLADMDLDGFDELITLDSTYEVKPDAPAIMLKIWEWNGFGFSLVSSREGAFNEVHPHLSPDQHVLLFTH